MGCQKSQNYQRGGDLGGLDCWGLLGVGDMAWHGWDRGNCWEAVGSWGHWDCWELLGVGDMAGASWSS